MALILFEDDDLLAIVKPAGINTHSAGLYLSEGIYEWLRDREPRWKNLALLHRLDKETSGILVFSKTKTANQALAKQFEEQSLEKVYIFITDHRSDKTYMIVRSAIERSGERYRSRTPKKNTPIAETRFTYLKSEGRLNFWQAEIPSGKTHQIRVHAADENIPILGDTLYGGSEAERIFLHAQTLTMQHPTTRKRIEIKAPADFDTPRSFALRRALFSDEGKEATNFFRFIHGDSDRRADLYVDRVGDFLLAQSVEGLSSELETLLKTWSALYSLGGVYHKRLRADLSKAGTLEANPQHLSGTKAPEEILVLENGLKFALSFNEGYSIGLFGDQRDNRRRLLHNYVKNDFPVFDTKVKRPTLLNTFAYTCGFSICAAKAGAKVTNIDLSKKYLEWGKRNHSLNKIDPSKHEFFYGDVFDFLKRFKKKNRQFDAIILDPPTSSKSKFSGHFSIQKDYPKLLASALAVLKSPGVLLVCANQEGLDPKLFCERVSKTVRSEGFDILDSHYLPQPPDFPISRKEPAYLKTLWLRLGRKS